MDREIEQQNKGTIKTTMLKQDHTFRQQVMELHRLYSAQRKLMDELKKETKQPKYYVSGLENCYKHSESTGGSCSTDGAANFRSSLASCYDFGKHVHREGGYCSSPVGLGNLSINGGGGSGGDVDERGEVDLTLSIGFGGDRYTK